MDVRKFDQGLEYNQQEFHDQYSLNSVSRRRVGVNQPDTWDRYLANMKCEGYFNNVFCDYDGGDCCLGPAETEYCELNSDCECHFTKKQHASFQERKNLLIGSVTKLKVCLLLQSMLLNATPCT